MSRTSSLIRQTFLLILASLCLSFAARAQSSHTFRQLSFYEGRRYESKVTDKTLESTPDWTDAQENPPLSARRAVELASAQLSKTVNDASKWGLMRVLLQPVGAKWVYVVEFVAPTPEPKDGQLRDSGSRDTFSIVVTMGGLAIEPKLRTPDAQADAPKEN